MCVCMYVSCSVMDNSATPEGVCVGAEVGGWIVKLRPKATKRI